MKIRLLAPGSFLLVTTLASAAFAQGVQRTFISGLGNDGNPCSRTAPCRTFAQAVSQTNAAGEVVVMDSAGYGPFTITKAVTVQAPPGVYAGISVFSGDGIDINAGASDTVILRGLTVNSQGGQLGINFIAGGALHVESCVVNGFAADNNSTGIAFLGAGNLEVKDSIIRNNSQGIFTKNSSGTAFATIDNTRLEGNLGSGLLAAAGSLVTVRNSVASGNGPSGGFFAFSDNANATELNVESCVVANNTNGIFAERTSTGAVTVRISNSTVTNNAHVGLEIALTSSLAVILSRGNNTVEGNGVANTNTTIGSYPAK